MTATNPGARRDAYKTAPETDAYQLGFAAGAAAGERLRAAVVEYEAAFDSTFDPDFNGFDWRSDEAVQAFAKRFTRARLALLASDAQPEPADQPDSDGAATMHVAAHHLVNPGESLNTCTNCGGNTLLAAPCVPARDWPLRPAPAEAPDERALAEVIAAEVWRIHGPESTDEESAQADGEEIARAVLAALPGLGYRRSPDDLLAEAFPRVQGRCPTCGGESLFLGAGGYVTCSRATCTKPDHASDLLDPPVRAADAEGNGR